MRNFFVGLIMAAATLAIPVPSAFPAAGPARSDPVGVSQSIDKQSVYIGDRIKFTVQVKAPKGCDIQFPAFNDYRIGDFEIKDSGSRVRNRFFGGKVLQKWYVVAIYATGKQTIPQVDIKYRTKGQKDWSVKKTAAITVNVASVLPPGAQATDIKDIKGPLSFKNVYSGIVSLVVALLLFLSIAIIIYKRLKRYIPIRLPHETALEELEAIRAQYLQGGEVKEFYVGVSDCVRHYIEHAFKLKAPEMTTEEFLDSLKDSPALTMGQKNLLSGFMNACDMVKFAKYTPSSAEAESVYTTAKHFIHETSIALTAQDGPSAQAPNQTAASAPPARAKKGGPPSRVRL